MAQTLSIFDAKADDFHLKEYECLKREVGQLSQDNRALERNVSAAVGILWGWLYSRPVPVPSWTYFTPCVFSILGMIRAHGIAQSFGKYGKYIQTIEDAFCKTGGPTGWEHFAKDGTPDSEGQGLFWIFLNASTFGVAVLRVLNILK